MLRKGIVLMLTVSLLASMAGCATPSDSLDTTANSSAFETTALPTTEATEPDDGSIKFYYDDRISLEELGADDASAITVKEQTVTSTIVGSSETDADVLYFHEEQNVYIAVGVGTALLDVNGTEVLVRVRPAPISLFMITGHSAGAGQMGNGAQSVAIEAGQAYSCHKTATFQEATDNMGIGFAAPTKPQGIDAFAPGGGGTQGEASAFAWKWNQLTGEKVWVLNAAVGGSVIPEWHQGQVYFEPAVKMYQAAAKVLSNEIKAGHYVLKNTMVIYHSGSNFEYKSVEFTDEVMEYWYDSMIEGFNSRLSMDYDGDGEVEQLNAIGIIPSTARSMKNDKPINYYLAATDQYPNVYIASLGVYYWRTNELLAENFPPIDYETQSEPAVAPANRDEMYSSDGVHVTQSSYNGLGIIMGELFYEYFHTEPVLKSIELLDENGNEVKDAIKLKRKGSSKKFVLITEPCYISNFTITLSDNLKMESPFNVVATETGEGFITISYRGEVLRHITVTVGD